MHPGLRIAKSGLDAQQRQMSIIAQNLANVGTAGYKKDRGLFEDTFYQILQQPGAASSQDTTLPSGMAMGTGVRMNGIQKLHHEGNFENTENAMDLAIRGQGYFQIEMPDGSTGYSRNGTFQVSSSGEIVNSSGYRLLPSITVPSDALSVTVSGDGIVSIAQQGQTSPTQLGQIQLADFVNPSGLQPTGENLFLATDSSGSAVLSNPGSQGTGRLLQGSLETSNVNVVEELINMIVTQRAYEANSNGIRTMSEMLQTTTQTLG